MPESQLLTKPEKAFFLRELERLGPDSPPSSWELGESERYCRSLAKGSYENFTVVSWLLPRRKRQHFYNVYAYCRWSDDLADEIGDSQSSLRYLDWWEQQLNLCYSGRPAHPILVALQETIKLHNLPRQLFIDLLSAFRQDQNTSRYDDDSELTKYCERSANPVGRILLRLAHVDDDICDQLSDYICTALQLTNFCQDMQRDAQMGRIYLPQARWINLSEADILSGRVTPPLKQALRLWVSEAQTHFDDGRSLVWRVPKWLALDVELFVRGGCAVLESIRKQDYDVWTRRPVVSKVKKARLFLEAFFAVRFRSSQKIAVAE